MPSRCFDVADASAVLAQTLNLGPDSSYGIFVNSGGNVSMSGGVLNGNMDLSAGVKPKIGGGTLNGHTNSNVIADPLTLPSGNAGTVQNNTYNAATSGPVTIYQSHKFEHEWRPDGTEWRAGCR